MNHSTELASIPSMSALLGNKGDASLLASINKVAGSAYFGSESDRYRNQHFTFMQKIVEPIRLANSALKDVISRVHNMDEIRNLESMEDLRNCPPCMMAALLTHAPLYSLLRQGRVNGWGYSADSLEDSKEIYDRIIDKNGVIDFDDPDKYLTDEIREERKHVLEDSGIPEEDAFTLVWEHDFDVDPELTDEDRLAIMDARALVDRVLEETHLDPTDMDNVRG